jgi:hypothetical protein
MLAPSLSELAMSCFVNEDIMSRREEGKENE